MRSASSLRRFAHAAAIAIGPGATEDPYLWLEDVTGDKPHRVGEGAERGEPSRSSRRSPSSRRCTSACSRSTTRASAFPSVQKRGKWLYNFWQDEEQPARRLAPHDARRVPQEGARVGDGARRRASSPPTRTRSGCSRARTASIPTTTRCLVSLSRGGADAVEIREFDMAKKAFVKDGFRAAGVEGRASTGATPTRSTSRATSVPARITTSGYPRIVKEWKRGTPLADGEDSSSRARRPTWACSAERGRTRRAAATRCISRNIDVLGERGLHPRAATSWVKLDTPRDADVAACRRQAAGAAARPTGSRPTRTFEAGSLIAVDLDAFLAGERDFEMIFEPTRARRAAGLHGHARHICPRRARQREGPRRSRLRREGGKWVLPRTCRVPAVARPSASRALDRDESDDYWMTVTSFVEPTTLYLATAGDDDAREDEVAAGVLRREGPEGRAVRGDVEGRHEDPVLRRDARGHEARRLAIPRSSTATAASRSR